MWGAEVRLREAPTVRDRTIGSGLSAVQAVVARAQAKPLSRGDGFGGPAYVIPDEINRLRYVRGVVGMALAGPDTGGSQFFIALSPQPRLDGGYTAFGEVVSGMDVADRLVVGDRIEKVVEVAVR